MPAPRGTFLALLSVALVLAACGPNRAEDELQPQKPIRSVNGICDVTLEAVVRKHPFGPLEGWQLQSPVYVLKSANGTDMDVDDMVGPLIRVGKGDRLRIRLKNSLKKEDLAEETATAEDYPHGYDVTNLHTHGLHVSPVGVADNVYVEIKPNESRQFEYQLLPNHPAGTFWYHPHNHGSVALQLTGGMAGGLIVDGGLDDIKGIQGRTEFVLVLQHIHGTVLDADKKILRADPNLFYDKLKSLQAQLAGKPVPTKTWRLLDEIRRQRNRSASGSASGGSGSKKASIDDCMRPAPFSTSKKDDNEWLLVNGKYRPFIRMKPGEIQRWRFIHAGLDEVVNLAIYDEQQNAHPLYEIAVDGIARGRRIARNSNLLYPAYRWDVLFQAPSLPKGVTEKTLYLVDAGAAQQDTPNNVGTPCNVIAKIKIKGDYQQMDFPSDADLAKCVPPEYREMISDQEIENRRWNVKFDFPDHDDATVAQFLINGREFAQDRIDRYVRLNTAEEWRIESGTGDANAAGHPFHIHVNPFQQLIHENVLTLTFAPANPDDKFPSLDSKVKDLRFNSDPKGIALKSKLSFQGVDPRDNSKFETTPIPLEENTTLGDLVNSLQQAFDVRNGMTPGGNGLYRSTLQVATNLANQRTVVRITDSAAGMIDKLQLNFAVNGKASSDFGFEKTRALVDFIWRDTLLAPAGGSAVLRMRFRDWAGKTVLHCHIVDHEDQGMMKNIRILGSDDLLPAELWRAEGAELASDRRLFRRQPVNAPDFDLPDADGTLHRLQEFPGKKVVLFFRGSGCLACNAQLEAYRNAAAKFREAGVTLVAISTTSPDDLRLALKKLGKNQKLPIALLADEKYETFDQYGCLDERDRQPLHGTFVIDAKGKIVWRNVDDEPFMDLKQVLEKCGQ